MEKPSITFTGYQLSVIYASVSTMKGIIMDDPRWKGKKRELLTMDIILGKLAEHAERSKALKK